MVMIGATNVFHEGDNRLSFSFKMSKYANHCVIEYVPGLDLYNMIFGKKRGIDYKKVEVFENIYCDQLREIFVRKNKLYLSI